MQEVDDELFEMPAIILVLNATQRTKLVDSFACFCMRSSFSNATATTTSTSTSTTTSSSSSVPAAEHHNLNFTARPLLKKIQHNRKLVMNTATLISKKV